jgi:hypothetical protein
VVISAVALLTLGLVLTAMRTVIVAFVIGASVIAFRSLRGVYKVVFTFALFFGSPVARGPLRTQAALVESWQTPESRHSHLYRRSVSMSANNGAAADADQGSTESSRQTVDTSPPERA